MKAASLTLLMALWAAPAFAACPPGQNEMLTVRLYFGQSMNGRPIATAAWRDFVARVVTPRFPDGFTIYDARGQWRAADGRPATPRRGNPEKLCNAVSSAIRGIADAARMRSFLGAP